MYYFASFWFQHTAARRRLDPAKHSVQLLKYFGFNTQPPEGGWKLNTIIAVQIGCFNTQPPEGGWAKIKLSLQQVKVSTHSRPKAAGLEIRVPSARRQRFNTQPPEGGWNVFGCGCGLFAFQHTAARRRLVSVCFVIGMVLVVSTHSRPKAAGYICRVFMDKNDVSTHSRPKAAGPRIAPTVGIAPCFNTQPPEGGWSLSQKPCSIRFRSPDFAKLSRKARTRV